MATREPVVSSPIAGSKLCTWTLTANGDIGRGLKLADFQDKTVGIRGTFDTTTIVLEGSFNSTDGVDGVWYTVTDPQANSILKTAQSIEAVMENPIWMRPRVTAGGAGTNVVIEMAAVKRT